MPVPQSITGFLNLRGQPTEDDPCPLVRLHMGIQLLKVYVESEEGEMVGMIYIDPALLVTGSNVTVKHVVTKRREL